MRTAEPVAVLDASALLAYLRRKAGFEVVREALRRGAAISAVNLAEALGKLRAKGLDAHRIGAKLQALGQKTIPFHEEDALEVVRQPKGLFPWRPGLPRPGRAARPAGGDRQSELGGAPAGHRSRGHSPTSQQT